MNIDYSILEDNRQLLIAVKVEGIAKWNKETLLRGAKGKDLDAIRFLYQQDSHADGMQFRIPFGRAESLLKLLGTTGRLFWKGKKVFVDPFTRVKVSLEVDEEVEAFFHIGAKQFNLKGCVVFPGDPPWMIYGNVVQFFEEEMPYSFLKQLIQSPQVLSKELAEELKDYPYVTWKKKLEPQACLEPTPYLVLKDRSGAFADLWFDYGVHGKVAMQDPYAPGWRQPLIEKGWEKDLLETDFISKMVGSSHYYCPLDKVVKSLTFLLEIGWPLYDCQGKQILRAGTCTLELATYETAILMKGKVPYAEHKADLQQVLGAFVRRERFVELSPHAVGLLDPQNYWDNLVEEEIISEGVAVKRCSLAMLEELFPKALLEPLFEAETSFDEKGAFEGKLYPYQEEGVNWLISLYKGSLHGLLSDDMGLGKTVQAIAFFSRLQFVAPILIVAPTSLLFNWRKEFEKFFPSCSVYVHAGEKRLATSEELKQKRVILTSYTLLRMDHGLLKSLNYQCLILDEAQIIKNPDTQIARAVCALQSKFRLAMTGTPIENRTEDLWSLFHFLIPELLGEQKKFIAELQAAQQDSRYFKNLRKKLHPFILRRTKADILDQLPEKIEQTLWIEMEEEQKQMYEEYLQKARSGVLKKIQLEKNTANRFEILEIILRLRQICCHPLLLGSQAPSAKFERLMQDLEEVVAEGKKVLVYSQFTQMLKLIGKAIEGKEWKYVYLDGSTRNREEIVEKFQTDAQIPIFLISLKAGGVGLNLTAADYVFIFDPWWNTAAEQQAIDRVHRLGRKGSIFAKRYATAWSIEEKMMRLKEHKLFLSKELLEFENSLYRNSLKDRNFDKEIPQILSPGRETLFIDKTEGPDSKFKGKTTTSKTDSSGCFDIDSHSFNEIINQLF